MAFSATFIKRKTFFFAFFHHSYNIPQCPKIHNKRGFILQISCGRQPKGPYFSDIKKNFGPKNFFLPYLARINWYKI